MANGINMDTLTQLGALGGVVVIAGIIFMAFSRGVGPQAAGTSRCFSSNTKRNRTIPL